MNQSVIPALCPMEETQRQLPALYCAQNCSQEALAAWLACVNFDTLPSQITCMASAAAAKTGFDRLPPAVTPRLRGLIKYIRTLNAGAPSTELAYTTAEDSAQLSTSPLPGLLPI